MFVRCGSERDNGNFQELNSMSSIILWLLLKLCLMAFIGYLVSLGISTQRQSTTTKKLETSFKQALEENHFSEFQSEIELASTIRGLKIQSQRFIPNIKPRFFFNLHNHTTQKDIEHFLESLPNNFAANVPALKISIEDSGLKDIYFYKSADLFQLGYKERDTIYSLGKIGLTDLADKIVTESKGYRFQNVSVESIIFFILKIRLPLRTQLGLDVS
jgi:hypothetical protein